MKNNHLHQYTDRSMLESICNEEDPQLLNRLAKEEQERFSALECKKEELDFGKTIKPQELPELFSEVKTEVDKFLGVTDIRPCKIGYMNLRNPEVIKDMASFALSIGAFYIPVTGLLSYFLEMPLSQLVPFTALTVPSLFTTVPYIYYSTMKNQCPCYVYKKILLKEEPRTSLILSMAHEYTHHIESSLINKKNKAELRALSEGLARSVERHIAQIYCERESNEAFMYEATKEVSIELQKVHNYIQQSSPIKKDLPFAHSLSNFYYAIGTSYFMLEEAKKGKGIYAEMIQRIRR